MSYFKDSGAALPSKQEVLKKWDVYTEAINPDSLQDAFEVADDEIERTFRSLLGR